MAAHDSYYRGLTEALTTKIDLSICAVTVCCFSILWQVSWIVVVREPTRGFSVLLPYRDYVSPSVAIGIYSSA